MPHRGNCGPLDTASGLSVRPISRSQPVDGCGGQSVLSAGVPPALYNLSYRVSLYSLSLPPPSSSPQQSCANPTIGTVARGRSRFQLRAAEGRKGGGAEGGRGRGNIVVNARSCERVRCLPLLPLLPLINVVSLPSFSNERNEQRQKPLRPQDDHHRRCPLF